MDSRNRERVALVADDEASDRIEYHESSDTYRTEFDGRTRPASVAVVTAVATATETDPLELPPLYSVIDPDALEDVVHSTARERPGDDTIVTFEYAGHAVTVNGHGTVLVEPGEDSRS